MDYTKELIKISREINLELEQARHSYDMAREECILIDVRRLISMANLFERFIDEADKIDQLHFTESEDYMNK